MSPWTGSVLFSLLTTMPLSDTPPRELPPTTTVAPRFSSPPRLLPPNPIAPLATKAVVRTDVPTIARVLVAIKDRNWTVTSGEFRRQHLIPLVGFRAGECHFIRVMIESASGMVTTSPETLEFDAAPLPAHFPSIDTTVMDPTRQEPGLTMFCAQPGLAQNLDNVVIMVDTTGSVIWFYDNPEFRPFHVTKARGGRLLLNDGLLAQEIDFWGTVHGAWFANRRFPDLRPPGAIPVDTDTFHHEFFQLAEGSDADFLALSTEARNMVDYPTDVIDITQTVEMAQVVGDVIVEFRRDGTIVREHCLLDVLDPYRLVYDSLAGFYNGIYGPSFDWSHGNAVTLDPFDGNYVLSLRHQDALVKLDRQSGGLLWILGDPRRWVAPWSDSLLRPLMNQADPLRWPFHQHAPAFVGPGRIVLFDNGNHRAIPPETPMAPEDSFSRVVEYTIDEESQTVRQSWDFGDGSWFSQALGNTDPLPITGNLLVTDGARFRPDGTAFARIFEVTHDESPEIVFEFLVTDQDPEASWTVYRAQRF